MKKYYMNHLNGAWVEISKEVMILNMVNHISNTEFNNDIKLRNDIYKEVSRMVNEMSLLPNNHTFSLDMFNSFHIIEKKEGLK